MNRYAVTLVNGEIELFEALDCRKADGMLSFPQGEAHTKAYPAAEVVCWDEVKYPPSDEPPLESGEGG